MSLLGIDVGTTGAKAAVYSEQGELIASAYEEYDMVHPQPGQAELDASQVWEAIKRIIGRTASQTDARQICALSVSSMGEAVVPITLDRQVLGPSLLNFDRRGEDYVPELSAKINPELLYRLNGNTLGNQYSLTKLLWLKREQPELYKRTDLFLHWSGFVAFMLGAEPTNDFSLANRTLLFDLEKEDWSDELLGLAGLDRAKLPRLVRSGTVIGKVAGPIASELGLPAGVTIVAGTHDQSANAVGCGVVDDGQAVYGMGTFLCITPVFSGHKDPALMLAQGLNTEHHAVPGRYVSFIYNQGGSLLKWYRDTFALVEKQAAAPGSDLYGALLSEMPTAPSRVRVLPHFSQTGPPSFIADSGGVLLGLTLETSRGEIVKGILEGAAYYLKECVDALPAASMRISDFRAAGGGSRSAAWIQLSADIFEVPFVRPLVTEAGTLGAAIVAGAGCGIFGSLKQGAEAMVRLDRTFEPNPALSQLYRQSYEQYKGIWPLLQNYLRAWHDSGR